ncbi:hypothetical protein [Pseudomonas sivasensis]|uniref:Uncharacterized protein n=1 Tax=Pseudomonas sivasensis TaxID=1880678 RepID=A0ABW8E9S6_9PSED
MLLLTNQYAGVKSGVTLILALIGPGHSTIHNVGIYTSTLAADAHNVDPAFVGEHDQGTFDGGYAHAHQLA